MKKCFTITVLRSKEDIQKAYDLLVKTKIYQGCELFYPYDISDEVKDTYEEAIQKFVDEENFNVVLHLPYGAKNNIATKNNLDITMKRLKDAIDFAGKCKAKGVTLHPGEVDGSLSKDEALALSIENTKILAEHAKKYNIDIMVENLIGSNELCLTIQEMSYFQKMVNKDNVGITLDCGHYHASGQTLEVPKDLVKYVHTFGNKIKHLHLHDNNGLRDEHKQMGLGTIDFVAYFDALKSVNFTGLYGSEVLFKDYSELLETSKKMDEFAGKKCQK
ncbi:MAG: sugar phosphate isomerase/epimerase [Bacilli bacterium]|nr:sugar phosphate isomerase/epimerase [Bacilli bacterium]